MTSNMGKAPLHMQKKASLDQANSKIFGHSVSETPTPQGRREIHSRRGKQVGLRAQDGGMFVLSSKDIVHEYNNEGELTRRFTAQNPPPDFEKLSQEELQIICNN